MEKKNILIISRTILPSQFPRSYRATELAKELSRQGHIVTLYAVLGNYCYREIEEECGLKIKNLGRMYFSKLNSDGADCNNFFDKLLYKLLHRLIEFPNIELMFKIPHVIKAEKNIDLLISIADPFPIHWGCALAKSISKKSFPKTWVADCGDPYMGNEVAGKKMFYFKYIEKWFCHLADYIVVPVEGAKAAYYPEYEKKIRVIPQGFQFNNAYHYHELSVNDFPTFAYAGTFYKGIRDPTSFLEYLTTLNTNFKFFVFTKNTNLIAPYIGKLGNRIEVKDYVPRTHLLKILSQMDFLINFENGTNVQVPSKLIDYALINKPILSLDTKSLEIKKLNEFLEGNYQSQLVIKNIDQYNIVNVSKQFYSLMS